MKRFAVWLVYFALATGTGMAQDAATEQRLNELSGRIEQLIATQEAQRKAIDELSREVRTLRERQNAPKPDYASNEDVKRIADALHEVDRKRMDDYEKIRAELLKLGKTLTATAAAPPPRRTTETDRPEKPEKPEAGFTYTVQKGDNLSLIVQGIREQGVKVTRDQILKANPTLKPDKLLAGQKIFIPAPKP